MMMRKLLIPFCFVSLTLALMSFQTPQPDSSMNYEKEWKTIDSLEREGLFRSALEQTEALFAQAASAENYPQVAKATIYRAKFTSRLEENGDVKSVALVKSVTETAASPLKPVLQSILGELYANYAEANYGKLSDRTPIPGAPPEDLQVWSLDQLIAESSRLYLASVEDISLAETPVDDFAAITTKPQNTTALRPSLYDFLAHRAIDHFTNERVYLTAPAYRFYIDQAEAFGPAADFVMLEFATRDTASFKLKALQIFQDLLKLHQNDRDPAAMVNADLKRLEFVFSQSVHDLKDSLYLDALQQLNSRYRAYPASSEVLYYLANYHFDQGQRYRPNPEDALRWEMKKAKAYCDEAVRRHPDSYGASLCKQLLTQITRKELNLRTEVVNIPGQSILAKIEYRNVERAHLRIVKLTEEERVALNRKRPAEVVRDLAGRQGMRRWSVKLPLTGDFQLHGTEIRIDDLPFGNYAVLISDEPAFSEKASSTGYIFTQVSNLGYFYRRSDDGNEQFLVMDRQSGRPLEGVLAEFYTVEYRGRDVQQRRKIGQGYTDADGMVAPNLSDRTSYQVRFSTGPDALYMGEGYYSYSRNYRQQGVEETHFFLDRAIYRPGQTVFFKALLLSRDKERVPSILPNQQVEITFFDVNNQEVGKETFRSNRFGTINGSFTAPTTGLRGSMRLHSSVGNDNKYFQVEEYKRPRFEVVMDTLGGTPALGESVVVSGHARAFAGSNVDNTQVTYRVVREVRFPWLPWWFRGGFFPFRSESMEIANGTLRTDAEGKFSVNFTARPDRSIPKDKKPVFRFTVYADVTDITGEVRSTQKTVTLGYVGLRVGVDLADQLDRNQPVEMELRTTNLDGGSVPSQGSVRIHRLRGPERVMVNRYWEKPDQVTLKEREFRRYFPHFAFGDENERENWPKIDLVYDENFDTGRSGSVAFDPKTWPVGHYVMVIKTTDQQGNIIEEEKYFSVIDAEEGLLPPGSLAWQQLDRETAQPGESANLFLGTGTERLYVLVEREGRNTFQRTGWQRVRPWSSQPFSIEEADRGNLLLHTSFVRYNRAFTPATPAKGTVVPEGTPDHLRNVSR